MAIISGFLVVCKKKVLQRRKKREKISTETIHNPEKVEKMLVIYDGQVYLKYKTKIGRARMSVIMNMLTKSAVLDSINIHGVDGHDEIFIPQNRYEREFWETSRELTKKAFIRGYNLGKAKKVLPEEKIRTFYTNIRKKDLQNENDGV